MKVLVKVQLLMFKKVTIALSALALSFNVAAQLDLVGEIKQGGLLVGKTSPNAQVSLGGKPLKLSADGYFTLGFGRDDAETVSLIVTLPNGEKITRTLTPEKRTYKEQRVNGIAKKIMNPNPEAVKRSRKDSAQVKSARNTDSNRIDFAKGFIAPIDGIITGVYGSRRVYNGKPGRPHFGLDYAGKKGDPVKAPADGVVTLYVPDMFYSGGTMIIDHGHGINSTFLHLSDSYVAQGDQVKQGQVVAAVGASGRATGPHLDWRVNWYQVKLDPALVLTVPQVINH